MDRKKAYWISFRLLIVVQLLVIGSILSSQSSPDTSVYTLDKQNDRVYGDEASEIMEQPVNPEEYKKTILAVGDSFTAGFNLESREYAWPNILEKNLSNNETETKVINLGDPATGIEEHADKLSSYDLEPDILFLTLNRRDYTDYKKFEDYEKMRYREDEDTNLSQSDYVDKNHKELWKDYKKKQISKSREYKIERFRTHLDRIKTGLSEDVEVYILLHDKSNYGLGNFLKSYTTSNDWTFINWRNFYKDVANKEEVVISETDPHFNRYGNRIWAEKLQEEIDFYNDQ